MFGGLGQDDITGGSSNFFSLVSADLRPDGEDMLFGGTGARIDRLDDSTAEDGTIGYADSEVIGAGRYARDARVAPGQHPTRVAGRSRPGSHDESGSCPV